MADCSTEGPLVWEEPQYENDFDNTSNRAREYAPEEAPAYPGQYESSEESYSVAAPWCEGPKKPGVNGPAVADAILNLMGFWGP